AAGERELLRLLQDLQKLLPGDHENQKKCSQIASKSIIGTPLEGSEFDFWVRSKINNQSPKASFMQSLNQT
ncbi:MAG: hypothetical protein AAF570_07750, partial [Bacteroidota bacterium]